MRVGASAGNVLAGQVPPDLVRQLLEARLHSELYRSSPHGLTESDVARDWKLLEQSMSGSTDARVASGFTSRVDNNRGNQP